MDTDRDDRMEEEMLSKSLTTFSPSADRATFEQVLKHLALLQACYPCTQAPSELKAKLTVFSNDLIERNVTDEQIEVACKRWRMSSKAFMPSVGMLFKIIVDREERLSGTREEWAFRIAGFFGLLVETNKIAGGTWVEFWGPAPGQPHTRAPADIVAKAQARRASIAASGNVAQFPARTA